MDDKDRTIRYQQTLIEKLETEIDRTNGGAITPVIEQVDTTNTATQTERVSIWNKTRKFWTRVGGVKLSF